MKKTATKKKVTAVHTSKPFFASKGEDCFFDHKNKVEQVFFVPDISRQKGALGGYNFANSLSDSVVHPKLAIPAIQRLPASLSAIPQTERTALKISTIGVTVPPSEINAVFTTTGTRTSYDPGGQTVFASNITSALQRGLASVGGYLANRTNALPLNSTINIALDLANYGGANTVYRFTWFVHTENRTTTNTMLIEEVGPATTVVVPTTVPSGSFTVNGQTFTLSGNWNNNDFAALQHALESLPASALRSASGLTFNREGHPSGTPEGGHYSQDTDTVHINDNAFPNASLRIGTATQAEHNILHEIGHALDLRVLERSWQTFNSGGQTAAGRRTLLAARSLSGSRYIASSSGDYDQDLNLDAARDGDFRVAARADLVRRDTTGRTLGTGDTANLSGGVTEYSEVDYQELYAESFSLYITDRNRLRMIRPNVSTYFQRRYP